MGGSQFLDFCEQLEKGLALTYEKLSRSFPSYENASSLFDRLRVDEPSRLDSLHRLQKMAGRAPGLFAEGRVDRDEIKRIFARLHFLTASELSFAEGLNHCCWIERRVADAYVAVALEQSNRDTANLLIRIAESFRQHYTLLRDYMDEKGIAVASADIERRSQFRIPYDENIMVNEAMMFKAVDLSEGGIFLSTGRSLQQESVLRLDIPLKSRRLTVNAKVQFNKEGVGVGLKFIDLDAQQKTLIKDCVDSGTRGRHGTDFSRKKILFVRNLEYPPPVMNMYICSLTGGGFAVLDVHGHAEAVHLVNEGQQLRFIILAIASVDDPNFNLLSYIKQVPEYNTTTIMVISLNSSSTFEQVIRDAGADRYLTKLSTPPNKLVEILRSYE